VFYLFWLLILISNNNSPTHASHSYFDSPAVVGSFSNFHHYPNHLKKYQKQLDCSLQVTQLPKGITAVPFRIKLAVFTKNFQSSISKFKETQFYKYR